MADTDTENTNTITIPYESISKLLGEDKKNVFENQKGQLSLNEFVKTAGLKDVVATVSIPSEENSQLSILEIKIGDQQIYTEQQGGRKSTRRYGGRKSRVSTRRGGGRKSRRRHNYI
jgi:hypothetical protein